MGLELQRLHVNGSPRSAFRRTLPLKTNVPRIKDIPSRQCSQRVARRHVQMIRCRFLEARNVNKHLAAISGLIKGEKNTHIYFASPQKLCRYIYVSTHPSRYGCIRVVNLWLVSRTRKRGRTEGNFRAFFFVLSFAQVCGE